MTKLTFKDFLAEEVLEFFIILFTILLSMVMGLWINGSREGIGPEMMLILGGLILFIMIYWKAQRRFSNYEKSNEVKK